MNYNKNLCIVSPDIGGTKRASALADTLKCEFACIIKKRLGDYNVSNKGIVGDVSNKNVIIVDDIGESLGTILEAAKTCKENGALSIRAAVAHGLLNEIAMERLTSDRTLEELIITNTVKKDSQGLPITILDSSELFGDAINCIHENKSISELFTVKGF